MALKPEQIQFIERMAAAPDLVARDLVHLFDGNFGIEWMDRALKVVAEDRVRQSNLAGMLLINCLSPAAVGLLAQDTRYAFSRMTPAQQAALDKALSQAIATIRMSHAAEIAMSVPLPGEKFSHHRRRTIRVLLLKWLELVPDHALGTVLAKRGRREIQEFADGDDSSAVRVQQAASNLLLTITKN